MWNNLEIYLHYALKQWPHPKNSRLMSVWFICDYSRHFYRQTCGVAWGYAIKTNETFFLLLILSDWHRFKNSSAMINDFRFSPTLCWIYCLLFYVVSRWQWGKRRQISCFSIEYPSINCLKFQFRLRRKRIWINDIPHRHKNLFSSMLFRLCSASFGLHHAEIENFNMSHKMIRRAKRERKLVDDDDIRFILKITKSIN